VLLGGRLLILRALKLGDLLCAIPALRGLARAFPDQERILAAPAWLEPLVELVDVDGHRAVDRLVAVGELEPLPPAFSGCEIAVNLHGRGPESHRLLLAVRPQRTLWFEHPEVPASAGAPAWRAGEHEIARWCRMLAAYGVAADPADIHLQLPARPGTAGVVRGSGATVLHPGASSPARRWPLERFAVVARAERERGREVQITGTGGEVELAYGLADAAGLPHDAVLAGRTELVELAHTIARAGRVVCGDTGVAHLAFALSTPSVVLFGPTSPAHWGPRSNDGIHRVLWADRRGDPHGEATDPGLLRIQPEEVIAALEELP
jgi:ADP-heptose:LPS heptosyltransferase